MAGISPLNILLTSRREHDFDTIPDTRSDSRRLDEVI